jgi:short-subunit dehydrogenase
MTNTMLPLMSQNQYARIIFTVSVTSYFSGAAIAAGSYTDVYFSSKNALRVYANNLATALQASGSIVRVSTVNPYSIKTALADHPNPIYTQPVNNLGLSDTDPAFNEVVTLTRQLLANALPTSMVGQTYTQLLSMVTPDRNVVVASPQEPFATQGANAIVEGQILAENQISAVPFGCS